MKRITNLLGLITRPKPQVGVTPSDVVWAENKWRLLRYRPRPEGLSHHTPLLLVPSLINRHYVLDLMPGKSFAEYMVAQGFDVYCIDWGTPGDEDRYVTFDDIVDTALGRAIRKVASTVPHQKTHVLGYCMGGMLSAGVFLSTFIPDGQPWVHLDIAGPAFNEKGAYGYLPKGGTGAAVRTFVRIAQTIAAG